MKSEIVLLPGFLKRLGILSNREAIFGVKDTLVAPYERVENGQTIWQSSFDFVLTPLDVKAACVQGKKKQMVEV
ncbi:hypothetical protein ACM5Q9_07800 [Advenella sp. RU8]|uniref:hypothetical protein n=1 Tax=Advenella sp. RU8 TaxID=3399575 RepID=UPI003AAC4DF6